MKKSSLFAFSLFFLFSTSRAQSNLNANLSKESVAGKYRIEYTLLSVTMYWANINLASDGTCTSIDSDSTYCEGTYKVDAKNIALLTETNCSNKTLVKHNFDFSNIDLAQIHSGAEVNVKSIIIDSTSDITPLEKHRSINVTVYSVQK